MARIGILGGTFDPIHLGHIQMAEEAYRQADLDQVLFLPSKIPPHKRNRNITEEFHRTAMIKLAIQHKSQFVYSDFELQRDGITYTVDTLRMLQEQNPEHDYYFILGGDSLFQLETWYHPEEIMSRVEILAISRYDMSREQVRARVEWLAQNYQARIQIVEMSRMDISSSDIRDRVRRGDSLQGMVPNEVENYIQEHSLYQSIGGSESDAGRN